MTVSTPPAKESSSSVGDKESQKQQQRLEALDMRLKQAVAVTTSGFDRQQVLAKAAELRALAGEFEELAASIEEVSAAPLTKMMSRRRESDVVQMPRLGAEYVKDSVGDDEFSKRVAVPLGGLSFIASAAVMQESEDEQQQQQQQEVVVAEE
ncbi:hypothetical protein IWW38_006265, partial [Coemansia aciculifera]